MKKKLSSGWDYCSTESTTLSYTVSRVEKYAHFLHRNGYVAVKISEIFKYLKMELRPFLIGRVKYEFRGFMFSKLVKSSTYR